MIIPKVLSLHFYKVTFFVSIKFFRLFLLSACVECSGQCVLDVELFNFTFQISFSMSLIPVTSQFFFLLFVIC